MVVTFLPQHTKLKENKPTDVKSKKQINKLMNINKSKCNYIVYEVMYYFKELE